MARDLTFALLVAAMAADGLLAGASLDQSLKQLPARHRMGPVAFSVYSQAADLSPNGVVWYASLGVGAALLTLLAAGTAARQRPPIKSALPLYMAAGLSVLHSLATTRAAPTNFSQRRVADDAAALDRVLDRFERWQTLRAALQIPTFGATLWALATAAAPTREGLVAR
jgi:hypothetical protein